MTIIIIVGNWDSRGINMHIDMKWIINKNTQYVHVHHDGSECVLLLLWFIQDKNVIAGSCMNLYKLILSHMTDMSLHKHTKYHRINSVCLYFVYVVHITICKSFVTFWILFWSFFICWSHLVRNLIVSVVWCGSHVRGLYVYLWWPNGRHIFCLLDLIVLLS